MTRLIERNMTIPTKKSQIFSTAADSQTAVSIHVLQGEREMAPDNRTLGRFDLIGIPSAPRGVPQIEVSFDIDANGIVHVSAKDLGTGKEQKIRIESSSGLSKEEINNMVNEAKGHETEDKKKRELIEARNQLDTLIYTSDKSLKEYGEKLSLEERKKLQDTIDKAKEVLDSGDLDKLKKVQEELTRASHKLAEEIYKASAAQQAAKGAQAGPAKEGGKEPDDQKKEDIVDAEYKTDEENKEKKE